MLRSTASDVTKAILNVVTDPCLATVAQQVNRLHTAEVETATEAAAQAGLPPPPTSTVGIGLCYAVKPLQAVVFIRENPWVAIAGAAGFLGLFVGIGYRLGKRSKSK